MSEWIGSLCIRTQTWPGWESGFVDLGVKKRMTKSLNVMILLNIRPMTAKVVARLERTLSYSQASMDSSKDPMDDLINFRVKS